MATIGSLSVKLGLVTVEWDSATEKAKKQAKDLQAAFNELGGKFGFVKDAWDKFGAALSTAAMGALIHETIQFTDEIADLAKGFDITISQTLHFRDALMSAGANADGAAKVMSTLFAKIDDARQGNDQVVGQFEKLGITFHDIKQMAPYEAIQKVAKGFENIGDSFERVKMIKEFFGKQGIGLSIDDLNEALGKNADRFDKYADSIKKVGDISDATKRNFENLKIAVADLMAQFPIMTGETSPERFSQILKALAAGAVTAGILTLGAAFVKLGVAIREAALAGAAFNLIAGPTSPIGIAIKLLAAGAAAIVFFANGPEAPKDGKPYKSPMGEATDRDEANDAKARGEGAPAQTVELTKQAQQRAAAVQLTRDLIKLDADRLKILKDVEHTGDLSNQLALNDISMREKLLNIDSKLAQEMVKLKDEGNSGLIAQAQAAANAEKDRVRAEAAGQAEILRAKNLLDIKQKIMASDEAYLRSLGDSGADNEQETEGQKRAAEEERQRARWQLSNQVKEAGRLADLENERTRFMMQNSNLSERELESVMARYDLEAKITEYRREAMAKGETNQNVIEAHVKIMRDAGEEAIRLKEQTQDVQRTFQYGWTQAYNQFADSTSNAANVARDMFNSVTNNMSSAIDQFVNTGKVRFKDFAGSVIRDLIAIQLKMQAMSLLRMALGAFSFGGGGGGGGGVDYSLGGGSSSGLGLKMKASGGPVGGGEPYMVGENGPELFVPNKSGSIVPNGQLASALNQGPSVVYNGPYIASMNAIDTQSATQFLSRNKDAVWAANQSASRSMPQGR